MFLGLGFNVFIVFSDQLFVESRHSNIKINALKTFVADCPDLDAHLICDPIIIIKRSR